MFLWKLICMCISGWHINNILLILLTYLHEDHHLQPDFTSQFNIPIYSPGSSPAARHHLSVQATYILPRIITCIQTSPLSSTYLYTSQDHHLQPAFFIERECLVYIDKNKLSYCCKLCQTIRTMHKYLGIRVKATIIAI